MSRITTLALTIALSTLLPTTTLAAPSPQIAAAHGDALEAGETMPMMIQSRQCLPVGDPATGERDSMMMMMMMDTATTAAVDCADLEARQMYHGAHVEADGGAEGDGIVESRQISNFMSDGEATHE